MQLAYAMPGVPDHVTQTVESIAQIHARAQATVSRQQRSMERVTAKLGRPSSVYAIVLVVAAWVALNLLAPAFGVRAPDPPPFYWMQGAIALAALLMTTLVLTTQNRQTRHAEQRAQLDLQVNLLAEAKIAKLIALVEELRRDLPSVPNRVDPVAEAMKTNVDPDAVMSALEQTLESTHVPDDKLGR